MMVVIIVYSQLSVMVEVGSYQRIDYFELNFKRSFDSMSIKNLKYDYQNYVKKEYQEFEDDHL
jgi:hypothetical protein